MINQIDEDFNSGVQAGVGERGRRVRTVCLCGHGNASLKLIKLMALKQRLDWCSRSWKRLQGLRRLNWPCWLMLQCTHTHARTHTRTPPPSPTHPLLPVLSFKRGPPFSSAPHCFLRTVTIKLLFDTHPHLVTQSNFSHQDHAPPPPHHRPSMCDEGAYLHCYQGAPAGQATVERLRPRLLDDTYRHLSPSCVCVGVLGGVRRWGVTACMAGV